MDFERVENESEKNVIRALYKKDRESYSEIAQAVGLSVAGIKKIVKRLENKGIVYEPVKSGFRCTVTIRKEVIKLNHRYYEFLKPLYPSLIILGIIFSISGILLNPFLMIGALSIFIPQAIYSCFKIMKEGDIEDVYLNLNKLKRYKKV